MSALTPAEAQDGSCVLFIFPFLISSIAVCLRAWTSNSTPEVLSTVLFYIIPSIIYFLLAYIYYRQTMDPHHPAYLTPQTSRGSAIRMEELPEAGCSPLYNGHSPPDSDDITDALRARTPRGGRGQGQGQGQGLSGMGKGKGKGKGKPSGSWSGKGRTKALPNLSLSPVLHTASPYMMTPGPPSFSIGRSRDFGPAFFRVQSDA